MLTSSVSTALLGVPLTWQVVCGVLLVVGSTCIFNASATPPPRDPHADAAEESHHEESQPFIADDADSLRRAACELLPLGLPVAGERRPGFAAQLAPSSSARSSAEPSPDGRSPGRGSERPPRGFGTASGSPGRGAPRAPPTAAAP